MHSDHAGYRFQRQTVLPEIEPGGQQKLRQASVFIVGAGALASSAAYYLGAAGVGTIGIADDDRVEISNLNRQILHNTTRLGMLKVESARKTLLNLYPELTINAHPYRLVSPDAVAEAVRNYDLVIDCSDNYPARDHINAACLQTQTAWIYGAVYGFEGQAMTIHPGKGPCYRCLYPSDPEDNDAPIPVIGVSPGIIGIIQAAEAIKHILGIGAPLVGRMLFVDLLEMSVAELKVSINENCPVCKTCHAKEQ